MIEDKHKGPWAELMAQAHLIKLGYEVFGNASQHGPIDLVAVHTTSGVHRYFDVKLASMRRETLLNGFEKTSLCYTRASKSQLQKELDVEFLYVTPGGNVLFEDEIGISESI